MNTKGFSMIKMVLCMVTVAMLMSSHAFAISIDGNIQGFAEGYTSGYNVSFDIENGPTGVLGGSLFLHDDAAKMYVGIILPLTIVDNTYGDNKASDWGAKDHFLIGGGGGSSLEGSDKWEFKYKDVSGTAIELKLDYIEENAGAYSVLIEKFKEDGDDLDQSKIEFATSLYYNYNDLGLTQFFGTEADDEDGDPIDSPDYLEGWIPEVMYEFSIKKDDYYIDLIDIEKSKIHASPNKLGDKNVYPTTAHTPELDIANRPPALCKGCPHIDSFRALNEALSGFEDPQVFSDIGCYTLAALPPLEAVHSCVAMGASIGMAAGAAHAGYSPAVAAIGDSTFSHGGITPLLSAVQQNVNLNILVVDNSTVGMTGTQRSMSTGPTLDQIIIGTGISEDHFRIIEPTPRNHEANVEVIREELAYEGPSVIVARRACIEALKVRSS